MTPAPAEYLRYHSDVEVTQPHEAEDIAALRDIFAELRAFAFDKHRHGLRDAHARSHGVLSGTLRLHDDLPAELRQGLFAQARELPVIIRFSTAPGDIVPDGVGSALGMAIEVLGVDGEKALTAATPTAAATAAAASSEEGEGTARTQDFLLVNHPPFPPATCTPTAATRLC